MTLQEVAFMTDLVKKNYRRRIFLFSLHTFLLFVFLSLTGFAIITEMSGTIKIACILITAIIILPIIIGGADTADFPWLTKRRQANAIKQFREKDFEELKNSIFLKEYFEV